MAERLSLFPHLVNCICIEIHWPFKAKIESRYRPTGESNLYTAMLVRCFIAYWGKREFFHLELKCKTPCKPFVEESLSVHTSLHAGIWCDGNVTLNESAEQGSSMGSVSTSMAQWACFMSLSSRSFTDLVTWLMLNNQELKARDTQERDPPTECDGGTPGLSSLIS